MDRDRPTREEHDVARAAAGEPGAFERLYHRHAARVWSLARRLLGPARADDATQEVFLLAWRSLARFRGDAPFGAWLQRIARNWMLDEIERMRRERRIVGLEEGLVSVAVVPEPGRTLDLDAALHELPEGARLVLVLRHFAGCTHEEIARRLGVSVGTSKSQLHRARLLLRERLQGAPAVVDERQGRGR